LIPATYLRRLQLLRNPNHFRDIEGDIHTHEDDHIDWVAIIRTAQRAGAEVVTREDYLMYRPEYPTDVYEEWATRCNDMTALVLRRSR